MKKILIILLVVLVIIISVGVYVFKNKSMDTKVISNNVSEILINNDETKNSLYAEYAKFYALLEKKDVEAIKLFVANEAKMASEDPANNMTFENAVMRFGALDMITDADLHMYKLVPLDRLHLEISKDGKSARLVDADKDYPIVFLENDKTLAHQVITSFTKKDGAWITTLVDWGNQPEITESDGTAEKIRKEAESAIEVLRNAIESKDKEAFLSAVDPLEKDRAEKTWDARIATGQRVKWFLEDQFRPAEDRMFLDLKENKDYVAYYFTFTYPESININMVVFSKNSDGLKWSIEKTDSLSIDSKAQDANETGINNRLKNDPILALPTK